MEPTEKAKQCYEFRFHVGQLRVHGGSTECCTSQGKTRSSPDDYVLKNSTTCSNSFLYDLFCHNSSILSHVYCSWSCSDGLWYCDDFAGWWQC